jgi:GT2 family glycosyltransferase
MDGVSSIDESPQTTPPDLRAVGVVAIGRNEGDRLRRFFDSLPGGLGPVVYVDSASTDGSVEEARRRGIEAVALDMSLPFTAARARNAGFRRLRERWPGVAFVQFVDGDCALAPGWLEAASRALETNPGVAVVCGRRRERSPEASVYNRLCDMEWNTPVGDALSCGGDALARVEAVQEAGGYDDRLIAGEEPEMCARLRARGWRILRIDCEMTLHDAAMTSFGQWWKRTVRGGHAFAEVSSMHPGLWRREFRSSVVWGLVLPALAILPAPFTRGASLLLLAAYPALAARIARYRRRRGDAMRDAAPYAGFCVLGKFPELAGAARYWWSARLGRRSRLIEYK